MRAFVLLGIALLGCEQIVGIEEPRDPLSADAGTGGIGGAGGGLPDAAAGAPNDGAADTGMPDAGLQPTEHVPCEGTDCMCAKQPVAGAESEIYKDVLSTSIEAEAVTALHVAGVIGGCDDSPPLFCPGCQVARSAMVKWLVTARGDTLISPDVPTFTDVPKNHPFYAQIETAFAADVADGYADGTFRPNNAMTRGAAAVMIAKAAALQAPSPLPQSYSDVTPGSWWEESIEALRAECVTTGCVDGTTFCPDKLLTRRGGAVLVARAFDYVARECTPDP